LIVIQTFHENFSNIPNWHLGVIVLSSTIFSQFPVLFPRVIGESSCTTFSTFTLYDGSRFYLFRRCSRCACFCVSKLLLQFIILRFIIRLDSPVTNPDL